MPIRINLLAEAQAAEELRRRDPVKRVAIVAVVVVSAVVCWCATQQVKVMGARSVVDGLEAKWKGIEKGYQAAVEAKQKSTEVQARLLALEQIRTNRFLWGSALNALQQSLEGVEDVHVVRLKTEQAYLQTEEIRSKDPKNVKPASSTEKVSLLVEATDSSPQPGTRVGKFKDTLAAVPWFKQNLHKTNSVLLTSLSAPQVDPQGRSFVTFTFNCAFPEKVR